MFKVNKNVRRRSGVFIINFEHVSHLFLVFLFLILNKQMLAGILLFTSCSLDGKSANQGIMGELKSWFTYLKNRSLLFIRFIYPQPI